MNKIHNVIWSTARSCWVVVAEGTKSSSKSGAKALKVMLALLVLPASAMATTLPQGGQVTVGNGSIVTNGGNQMVIKQISDKLGINWQSFNVGPDGHVIFDQPGKNSIALNRVIGRDGSSILGKIDANGQVFLINPNGVIFGKGAEVNVGGLVASTLNISDEDFRNGNFKFKAGAGDGQIINEGSLQSAEGGYIALLGKTVKNNGVIQAKLGSVALAAGNAVSLDFTGDGLINLQVDQSEVNALVENKGLIKADGGNVLMTARASNALTQTVVNNEGIIQAQTIGTHEGKIFLDGGFEGGTVAVAGALDASAPTSGNGGFIETSGANVQIDKTLKVTTLAQAGKTGDWLIDPVDFNINEGDGAQEYNSIGADTLQDQLESTNVLISTSNWAWDEPGDINVNASLSWGANTTLTLSADRDININDDIHVNGDSGGLALNFDGRVNVADGHAVKLNGANTTYAENGKDFIILRTAEDLKQLSGKVTKQQFALGGDIDASVMNTWDGGLGYNPNNTSSDLFANSVFNGLGNTINNFYINRPDADYVGLIGYAFSSTISNVNINGVVNGKDNTGLLLGQMHAGSAYNIKAEGTVSGSESTGVAIGFAYGKTLDNIHTSGKVSGKYSTGGAIGQAYGNDSINNITSSAEVAGTSETGGVIGYSHSNDLITNLSNLGGSVTGTGSNTGGVIGQSYGDGKIQGLSTSVTRIEGGGYSTGGSIGMVSLTDSVSDIDVYGVVYGKYDVGGAIGYAGSTSIDHVKSAAIVQGSHDSVGGLLGEVTWTNLNNVYSTGQVTGYGSNTGGLIGILDNSELYQSAAVGDVTGVTNVGGLIGHSVDSNTETSFTTSNVQGNTTVGGFVGLAESSSQFTDSYANGTVDASNTAGGVGGFVGVSDTSNYLFSYAAGEVISGPSATTGGFAGTSASSDQYLGVVWDKDATGLSTSAGGAVGYTTAELKTMTPYGMWSIDPSGFSDVSPWRIYSGYGLPVLKFAMDTLVIEGNQVTTTYNGEAQSFGMDDLYTVTSMQKNDFYKGLRNPFSGPALVGGDIAPATNAGTYTASDMYGQQFGYNILQSGPAATVTIEKAKLTFDASVADKVYDGNTDTSGAQLTLNGVMGSDDIEIWNYWSEFSDKNAGADKNVEFYGILLGGTGLSNYTYETSLDVKANIAKADLTVTATGSSKTYDGTTSAQASLSNNSLAFDDVQVTGNAAFADKNAGIGKLVTVTDLQLAGDDAANYNLVSTTTSTTADIDKALLSLDVTGQSKVYDGSKNASVTFSDNRIAGDDLNFTAHAQFDDKNAGLGKTVSVDSIAATGADAGNYVYGATASTTADIARADLVITANASGKVYDGNTSATVTLQDDRISGDDLNISYDAAFADKNAGENKAVSVTNMVISGADASNYNITAPTSTTASISKAELVVTANADDKGYDGSTTANVSFQDTRISGDSLVISGNASFADKNAGSGKTVNVSGITLTGDDAGNYTVNTSALATADITKADLTVKVDDSSKIKGTADGTLGWSIGSGVLYGDDTLTGSLQRTPGDAVGVYAINQGTLSAGSNYNLTVLPGSFEVKPNVALDNTKEVISSVTVTTKSSVDTGSSNASVSGTPGDYRMLNLGMKLPDDLTSDASAAF